MGAYLVANYEHLGINASRSLAQVVLDHDLIHHWLQTDTLEITVQVCAVGVRLIVSEGDDLIHTHYSVDETHREEVLVLGLVLEVEGGHI